jgi:hypothetical protein
MEVVQLLLEEGADVESKDNVSFLLVPIPFS